MSAERHDTVSAVYELREAAVEHGRAMAEAERPSAPTRARDHLLATAIDLETKTAAALDECAESAAESADEAVRRSA